LVYIVKIPLQIFVGSLKFIPSDMKCLPSDLRFLNYFKQLNFKFWPIWTSKGFS